MYEVAVFDLEAQAIFFFLCRSRYLLKWNV